MLALIFRPRWNKVFEKVGKFSQRIGLTADFWTLMGLFLSFVVAYFLYINDYVVALLVSVLVLFSDALDGATARASGELTKFGLILDHSIDRYAEFVIYGGLFLGGEFSTLALIFAISGMIMASYVRAKAESVGVDQCNVGVAGRVEKFMLTYVALIFMAFNKVQIADLMIWGVAIISHITAIQRLLCARRHGQEDLE